jgi:hypothetical protein
MAQDRDRRPDQERWRSGPRDAYAGARGDDTSYNRWGDVTQPPSVRAGYGRAAFHGMEQLGSESGQGPHAGKGPRGYRRSDDRIQEEVSGRLEQDADIDASDIEVAVAEGVVTLTGTVPDRQMKRLLEDVVETCPGVRDVENHVRLASADAAGIRVRAGTEGRMGTRGSQGTTGQEERMGEVGREPGERDRADDRENVESREAAEKRPLPTERRPRSASGAGAESAGGRPRTRAAASPVTTRSRNR